MSLKDIFEWIWTADLSYFFVAIGAIIIFFIACFAIGVFGGFLFVLFEMIRDYKKLNWRRRVFVIFCVVVISLIIYTLSNYFM